MTLELSAITVLLAEMERKEPAAAGSLLVQHGAPDAVIAQLCEHVERLVIADLDRAMRASECIAEAAVAIASPAAARALRTRAHVLAWVNRFDDALGVAEQAIEHAQQTGNVIEAARAQLTRLHALARLGSFDKAIDAGQAAIAIFEKCGERPLLGKANANLGVVHRMKDDPASALECFDRAADLLSGEPPETLAQLQSNRAEALMDLHRFDDAETAFRAALDQFERQAAHRAAAIVHGNLADLLTRQGRIDLALSHFESAARHFESAGGSSAAPGDLARLRAEHAEAFALAGAWPEAVEMYRRAIPTLIEHGLAWEAARGRLGLGHALARLERFDEADVELAEAAERFGVLSHSTGRARSLLLRAELAMARRESAAAPPLLTEALQDLQERPADAARALNLLARSAIDTGNVPAAEHFIHRAMEAIERAGISGVIDQTLQMLAETQLLQGGRDEALAHLREAAAHIERVRGSLQADRLRSAFLGSRSSVYEQLISTLLIHDDAESIDEAFAVAEQSRSRALLDLMRGGVDFMAQEDDDDPLAKATADLRSRLNLHYSRFGEITKSRKESGDAHASNDKEDVLQLERELQVAEARLAVQRSRGVGALFAPPSDAGKVRSLLQPGTNLVQYFFAQDELIAFVLTPNKTIAIGGGSGLPSRSETGGLVERLYFQIGRSLSALRGPAHRLERTRSDLLQTLVDLHAALIAPIASSLQDADRLIVVPHGPLHAVPFHALCSGRDEKFLLEEYEMTFAPSASVLAQLQRPRERDADAGAVLVGFGDADAPMIEQEISQLAGVLKAARMLIGEEATFDNVVGSLADHHLIHLACHGRFSTSLPLASGLKLADRWLTVRDLFDLRLNRAIVTLSGCETGRAAVEGGDELIGLVRGFLAAGASSLVMSQWRVADDETAKMVADMYSLWHNGFGSIVACLRESQRRLIAENVHPVIWAPFIALGHP